MYDLFDYLTWRGDLTLRQVPFGDLDALALSGICYLKLPAACKTTAGLTLAEAAESLSLPENTTRPLDCTRVRLLQAMAGRPRYASLRLNLYVDILDPGQQIQFSALCCDLPDGRRAVCFRGTDATLVGWRENFSMSYGTVPAQVTAAAYLAAVSRIQEKDLLLMGHSKGGNLACYAAATAEPSLRRRIRRIWSFDGPGLADEIRESTGGRAIQPLLRAYIPQSSIIGLLMGQPAHYTVVVSSASGLAQHDAFTWSLLPPDRFETAAATTFSSQVVDRSLHEFLKHAAPEQRRQFVDAVFQVLESTGATTTAEMKTALVRDLPKVIQAAGELEPETQQMLLRLVGQFLAVTAATTLDLGLSGGIAQASSVIRKLLTPENGGTSHDKPDPLP